MRASLISSLFSVAFAHLCVLSPLQRGGAIGADKPGADICYFTQKCMTMTMGAPTGSYIAGQSAVVSLLKNVDHYQMNANFSIYLWDGKGVNSTLVGYYPDTTAPSMTVYQAPITIPSGLAAGAYVLESVYYGRGLPYFQCTDA